MHAELKQSAVRILKIHPGELRLQTTLKCGQSFRWIRVATEEESQVMFRCALAGRVITLTQNSAEIGYSSTFPAGHVGTDNTPEILKDYFNLSVDLEALYKHWSSRDAHFRTVSQAFLGLRMLRQDPFENLLSFICSSNNNIARITQMVQNLCKHYGKQIAVIDGHAYYDFPRVQDLLHNSLDQELRALGFGYRAKFIAATARQLSEKPPDFLQSLRSKDYAEAHAELMKFMGVGAKVADCVCLMSLDKHQAVPIDTHVMQIAQRDYKFRGKDSAMTKVLYDRIKNFFIELWGPYAGWAHSVLFTADLRTFQTDGRQIVVKKEVKDVFSKTEADLPNSSASIEVEQSLLVDLAAVQNIKREGSPDSMGPRAKRRQKRDLFSGR
ncbi:8-oxoguanine DNA glycosylase [Taphrina deformans PYCC 5710]|uniref:N-glycosylase/DNA lyase n=1 Tax=Taphrina deformans (strain PYCC 5710 / ATCC 11124 / CBS 356.35 / IMI 108563 / JCM 9778 / NBRC 8474) TaxID=1097556 RepID=R4X8G2_TAPDE|nr:8-oxoguanine DNA glycosylase [Taphrina deformans PYCC 5710]|eukprot:CCG81889.1 8-oxoguanine DNA glycosylase [Taphrina deformans PYCC 5710]